MYPRKTDIASYDDGPIDASIRAARQACLKEREQATTDTEGALQFDADGRPVIAKSRPTLAWTNRDIDTLLCAPSAAQRVVELQLQESLKAVDLAEHIATVIHDAPLSKLTTEQRWTCRFLAVHAVRSSQRTWVREATEQAVKDCVQRMKGGCGAAFRGLPESHLEALARVLVASLTVGYFGVTEGTRHLAPGEYLKIVDGEK